MTAIGAAIVILLAGLSLAGTPARAADVAAAVRIEDAWARRASMAGHGMGAGAPRGTGAAYITIRNASAEPETVLAASSDAADAVELHETIRDGEVMRMRPAGCFDIPAGGTLEMKSGGKHLMLINLRRDLKPGDRVQITLIFGRGGPMSLEVPVR